MAHASRRQPIKSTPTMAQVLGTKQAERQRAEADRQTKRADYEATKQARAETVQLATERGESVHQDGDRVRIARDGLAWLRLKRGLPDRYFDAGLKFRGDYETANGTGVVCSLRDGSPTGFGPRSGPTDIMLEARSNLNAALKALGSPLLKPYAIHVAGEGRMLTDPIFCTFEVKTDPDDDSKREKRVDPRRADHHYIAVTVALDILARHYGMIR
jgi:hypothetical protein